MSMKEIRLSRSNSGWNAEFLIEGKPDAEVMDLFKTNTIPTAFTKHADAVEVVSQLSRLNPGHRVRIDTELSSSRLDEAPTTTAVNIQNQRGDFMKAILTTIALCAALCLPLLPDTGGPAYAYDFSEPEQRGSTGLDDLRRLNDQRQLQDAQSQAQRQSQENDRLHSQTPQFNPREFDPPNPYNLYQNGVNGGRAQVCRRNASGMTFCQ
jgi:hypothetical protein